MSFILINVFIAILIDSYSKTQVQLQLDLENKKRFDVFHKGREYVKKLQQIQFGARLNNIDTDGDGKINANELAKEISCSLSEAKK